MFISTSAFALGIFCLLHLDTLPPVHVVLLLPLFWLTTKYIRQFVPLLLFLMGFSWALIRADHALMPVVGKPLPTADVLIQGTVVSIPELNHQRIRFLVDTNKQNTFPQYGIVRVSWYRPDATPKPGETWQLNVRLKRPYGFMNPGGFDYEAWLLRQGIVYTAYVRSHVDNKKIHDRKGYFLLRARFDIAQKLKQMLSQPLLGLTLALSLGDRSLLSDELRQTLTKTGTNHLIAISGLHLSLIASLVYFVSLFISIRLSVFSHYVPVPMFAAGMTFIAATAYAMLAGFSLPTQRALIMISVFLFTHIAGDRYKVLDVISIAIIFILILDPFAIIAVDFWLSFSAVLIILYLVRFRHNNDSKLMQWFKIQFFLSVALLPMLVYWFYQIPVFSAFANMMAISVIGFMMLPLILLAIALLYPFGFIATALFKCVEFINSYLWIVLDFFAHQQDSTMIVGHSGVLNVLLALVGVILLFAPRGLPVRLLAPMWLLPLFFPKIHYPDRYEFDFTLLDVGQGLAALVRAGENVLVYDTGARFSDRFDIGTAVLIPYLKYYGIDRIDTLVISHGDNDHIGGAAALIDAYPIDRILTSVPQKIQHPNVTYCQSPTSWQWQGVYFEILHPVNTDQTGNNASCVLKISSQFGSVLLTGDIEKQAEKMLIRHAGHRLKADILLAPHHGSRTSSTVAFVQHVDPEYAFFAAGYKNRFGFPKKDIIKRYQHFGIKTKTTYQTGALLARFRENGLSIEAYRQRNARFWHLQEKAY